MNVSRKISEAFLEEKTRGFQKIEGAAKAFRVDFAGKKVLDIGSSTGGFTDYALRNGASSVVAVEKGKNQMKVPLRFDPRVDLREQTDVFDVTRDMIGGAPDMVVADVSFVSLKDILRYVKNEIAGPQTEYLVMLKPQFEARADQLNMGVVKNEKIRREIIKDFENFLRLNKFFIQDKRDNTLAGKHGNVERFYLLKNASR